MHTELSILTIEHPLERRILSMLSFVLVFMLAGYLYLVTSSILNIVARKEALANARSLESGIGSLEQEYLALSEQVSPEFGVLLGLAPISHTAYVRRPGSLSAAISRDEI